MLPPIKGLIENSLIEWEGQITAVVFLPGCNLRCRYCHAPHLVLEPDQLENIPIQAVRDCIASQRGWVDGVVISGGEPTGHGQELRELIRFFRRIPTRVFLETNGTHPDVLHKLLFMNLLDGVAMDVKAPLAPVKWRRITRSDVNIDSIRQSIRLILDKAPDHEFRVTLVPGYITHDDVEAIARSIEGARRLALQNFRLANCLDESLGSVVPFATEELEAMAKRARPYVQEVVVRGATRVNGLSCLK